MKIDRKISFIFYFLFAIAICNSLDSIFKVNNELNSIEYTETSKNIETENASDLDFCDDDQILSEFNSFSFTYNEHKLSPIKEFFLLQKTLLSIWQPPKL
jgi:hypothetical protein